MTIRHLTFWLTTLVLTTAWLATSLPAADDVDTARADESAAPAADRPHRSDVRPAMRPSGGNGPTTRPDEAGRRPRPDRDRGRWSREPDEEQVEQVRAFLKEHDPKVLDRLSALKESDPEAHRRQFRRVVHYTQQQMELRQSDPELFQLMRQEMQLARTIHGLADELAKAEAPEVRSDIEHRIREELGKRFELSQQRRRVQVKRLQSQVDELKQLVKIREANKERIIESQLQTILERVTRAEGDTAPAAVQARAGRPTSQPDN